MITARQDVAHLYAQLAQRAFQERQLQAVIAAHKRFHAVAIRTGKAVGQCILPGSQDIDGKMRLPAHHGMGICPLVDTKKDKRRIERQRAKSAHRNALHRLPFIPVDNGNTAGKQRQRSFEVFRTQHRISTG